MKTTEQIAVARLMAEINIRAIEEAQLTQRVAARYIRLHQIRAALTLELQARLDGCFEVQL